MHTNVNREELPIYLLGEVLRTAASDKRSLYLHSGRMEYKPDLNCYCFFGLGKPIYDEDLYIFVDKVFAYLKAQP